MNNLVDLEKKINSELTTKINSSSIKHEQIYINVNSSDIIEVISFLKTNIADISTSFLQSFLLRFNSILL